MSWLLKHKIVAIGIIITIAAVFWYMLAGSQGASDAVLSAEAPAQVPPEAQELVETLLTLRAVTLQSAIFSSPAFHILRDFSTPIVPEPVGRPNPFAPLGVNKASSASSTPARAPAR